MNTKIIGFALVASVVALGFSAGTSHAATPAKTACATIYGISFTAAGQSVNTVDLTCAHGAEQIASRCDTSYDQIGATATMELSCPRPRDQVAAVIPSK